MKFVWTAQNIAWFEKAAQSTTFYSDIVAQCRFLLDQSTTALDLGCGTGHLSIALAPHVQSVTALDINSTVIKHLEQKCQGLQLTNISLRNCDWRDLKVRERFEIVFLSYCDGIGSPDLYRITALARQYVVAILPQNKHNKSFFLNQYLPESLRKKSRKETLSHATSYLKAEGIPYRLIRHSCEFGQPFTTLEEYQAFLSFYYQLPENAIPEEYTQRYLQKTGSGYYLPNVKESGIIIIRKDDIRENHELYPM
ncbi:MAG TPA: class I SAM-dependent methyltransferase [Clostridia bacterium]|nr:class I SAM-dependent methyltransferase [Clostridia bacterium]